MAFIPNPPPTSGLVTRTASGGRPSIRASSFFCVQTPCPFTQRCSRAPSHSAQAPRGSIGFTITRLWITSSRTRCAAPASAAAVPASCPIPKSKHRLPGASGWIASPPGSSESETGRSSMSKVIASAASRAASRLSATISATASPTNRTRPSASTGRAGAAPRLPSRLGTRAKRMPVSTPAARRSCAVSTRCTPGVARAASTSSPVISACARSDRRNHARKASFGAISST